MATKLKQISIDQFMNGQSRVIADAQQTESTDKPQKKRGRKFQNRTIPKEGGIIVYLEERHKQVLQNTLGITMQDVLRTALSEFLKQYEKDGRISYQGCELVSDYIKSTTK